MATSAKKYRFLLIQPFQIPGNSKYYLSREGLPKEKRLMNYDNVKHLLADVEWDLDEGPVAPYGDWAVENREEFCLVAAGRIPIVRAACESGRYNAIVLLGGGEPAFLESLEIGRKYGVAVTSNASSQMHIACLLGNKFSVIDFAESHNMYYRSLIIQHRFADRCASIRNIGYYHPRPGYEGEPYLNQEKAKALRGEDSQAVETAVKEAEAALSEDGAEVITFGCSGVFWLQPFVQKGLLEKGWEVPVLEGYSCAIELAKLKVNLGLTVSGITFPDDRPKQRPRKVVL